MRRGYIYVEGHGEKDAILNLIHRLWRDLGLPFLSWAPPVKGLDLLHQKGIDKICQRVRMHPDAAALLIIRDDEDDCPAESGPRTASWIARHGLPFPAASVMMYREYETLFLPCAALMAGKPLVDDRGVVRPGLIAGSHFDGDPTRLRGAKEWLSRHMPPDRRYKPALDQLPLTRLIDFPTLRASGLACFGTLERALRFIATHQGLPGVYPPPPP